LAKVPFVATLGVFFLKFYLVLKGFVILVAVNPAGVLGRLKFVLEEPKSFVISRVLTITWG